MKEIKAIIHSHMVDKVVRAMRKLTPFPGITLMEVRGRGRGLGVGGAYAVTEDDMDFHEKTLILIACPDDMADAVKEVILRHARTGRKGDGIVIVTQAAEAIRIGTGPGIDSTM